jgi:hypothetical protein
MEEENISCNNCGSLDYNTSISGPHLKATCKSCGKFIKFISQNNSHRLYFGKYKGFLINEMVDVGYLIWLIENTNMKRVYIDAINERIEELKMLDKLNLDYHNLVTGSRQRHG